MITSWETSKTIANWLMVNTSNQIEHALFENMYEPSDSDIPVVHLLGKIPTSKKELYGQLEYASETCKFHAYIKIKCQGNSSMTYPKKNFSIELFADAGCSIPMKRSFKKWGNHNNYVLKANYIDHLHARNIVCANLWADIVRSRDDFESLPEELKNSPNMGAIDGFPVKVYANGKYQGLYTWNIPQCDWQFGLDKLNPNHALFGAEFNDGGLSENKYNPCNFNTLWDGNETYWIIEVGSNSEGAKNLLNTAISAVINGDTSALENVVDIKSMIEYFVFQDVIGGTDGLAKNMHLVTYDMQKLYFSAYDLDCTFDLFSDGTAVNDPYITFDDCVNKYSWLIYMIGYEYIDEYIRCYHELRNGSLSYSNIMDKFEQFLKVADEDVRIEDTLAYPNIPLVTVNNAHTLRDYIIERLSWLDTRYSVSEEV